MRGDDATTAIHPVQVFQPSARPVTKYIRLNVPKANRLIPPQPRRRLHRRRRASGTRSPVCQARQAGLSLAHPSREWPDSCTP